MIPETIDVYENGDVSVEEHFLGEDNVVYWIKSGLATMHFNPEQLSDLTEILCAIRDEARDVLKPSGLKRLTVFTALSVILFLMFLPVVSFLG